MRPPAPPFLEAVRQQGAFPRTPPNSPSGIRSGNNRATCHGSSALEDAKRRGNRLGQALGQRAGLSSWATRVGSARPSGWKKAEHGAGNEFTRRASLDNDFGATVIVSTIDNAIRFTNCRARPAGRLPAAPAATWHLLPSPPRRILRHPRHARHPFHLGEDAGNRFRQRRAGRTTSDTQPTQDIRIGGA